MNNLEQGNLYQLGGAFLDTTNAFVPPTGKVVVKIEFFATTKFTTLTPANELGSNTCHIGTSVVADDTNYAIEGNGTNAVALVAGNSGTEFTAGKILYGRWSAVTLNTGSVIMYFGQA